MGPQDIEQYVGWILNQKPELKPADPEVEEQLRHNLADRLEDQVNAAILAALPAEEMENFNQLLKSESDDKIQEFLRHHIPNLDEIVAGVLNRFKTDYLGA